MREYLRTRIWPLAATAICLATFLAAAPTAINEMEASAARKDLQVIADEIAVATLFAEDATDHETLQKLFKARGIANLAHVSTLRRYETRGGRASEVVILQPVHTPPGLLAASQDLMIEVTGRAITFN